MRRLALPHQRALVRGIAQTAAHRTIAVVAVAVVAFAVGAGCAGAAATALPLSSAEERAISSVPAWSWPVGPPASVTRDFSAPPDQYSAGHRGVDLAAASGTPVFAASDGVVSFTGTVVDRPVISLR